MNLLCLSLWVILSFALRLDRSIVSYIFKGINSDNIDSLNHIIPSFEGSFFQLNWKLALFIFKSNQSEVFASLVVESLPII